MKKNRREFLGMSLALGLSPFLQAGTKPDSQSKINNNGKLKILILGGTSF